MKRQLYATWFLGALTGAGVVLAWQVGNWQRKIIEAWARGFR